MQAADLKRKKKRKRTSRTKGSSDNQNKSVSERRKDNDPLQSFQGELDDLGIEEENGEEEFEDPLVEEINATTAETSPTNGSTNTTLGKAVLSTRDGTGRSTSGRNAWKEKRRKGKFSQRSKQKNK